MFESADRIGYVQRPTAEMIDALPLGAVFVLLA
jgi:hypothetical protein